MKQVLSLIFFFGLCLPLYGSVELVTSGEAIDQGSIQKGALRFSGEDLTKVGILKLSNLQIDETIYISHSDSVVTTEGASYLDVPITFTFTNVPQKEILEQKIGDIDLHINISGIEVKPSDAGDQFVLEEFSIPIKKEWGIYFLFTALLIIVLAGVLRLLMHLRLRRDRRLKLKAAKSKILAASTYDEITQVWQSRDELMKNFPEAQGPFRKFESVYFQYAFKPSRSEAEVKKVGEAYGEFTKNLEGGEGGV